MFAVNNSGKSSLMLKSQHVSVERMFARTRILRDQS